MIILKSILLYLPLLSILCCCQSEKHEITFEEQKNWEVDRGVSIEISMPYGDSLRSLGVCWDKNPIDVIIRNQSDSVIYFYEDWNSWGYYNIKFQIETGDSIYNVTKTKNSWWKNFPSYHSINPNESLVFHYNLIDSACLEHNTKFERLKGAKQWKGLPQKDYDHAKIRVIYELPTEYKYLVNRRYLNMHSYLENESDALIENYDTISVFSKKLISSPINIKVIK